MKKGLTTFGLSVALSLFLFSCGHSGNKQVIISHFTALNSHDIDRILKDYDPKVKVTSSSWEGIHNGTDEVRKVYSRYFKSTPNMRYDIGDVYFTNDSVVVAEYTFSGALSAPENGEPSYMTGKKYMINACGIFTIRDGKIVKESNYFDQVSFLRQVGFFDHVK